MKGNEEVEKIRMTTKKMKGWEKIWIKIYNSIKFNALKEKTKQ